MQSHGIIGQFVCFAEFGMNILNGEISIGFRSVCMDVDKQVRVINSVKLEKTNVMNVSKVQ
jgi:hypothetical protein